MARAPYIDGGEKALCTGCAACAHVCPVSAISMGEDSCGFAYPVVDESLCVDCGKCACACHMTNPQKYQFAGIDEVFGAYTKDETALRASASGGVATQLCTGTIEADGVAYGCVSEREDVHHERISTRGELEHARGSRYVQSDISMVYSQAASDLRAGREVIFVGTPCQCAALRAVFGPAEKLLLVDLVCEGVPSRRMYAGFLTHLEADRGEAVSDFRFRDKRGGWSTKNAVVVSAGGRLSGGQPHSYYYYYYYWLFTQALILRESCYACPYACAHRVGDITVGDFWGAETSGLGYSRRELYGGVSCVLISSEKGEAALERIRGRLDMRRSDYQTVARSNSCLMKPSSCDEGLRHEVLEAYRRDGAEGMESVYRRVFGPAARMKAWLAAHVPFALRLALKRTASGLRGR